MILEIEAFANPDHIKCSHPRCDGRDAKWSFPQSADPSKPALVSCSVHVARFLEIVQRQKGVDIPVHVGRKQRAV